MIQKLYNALLELLFPPRCPLCDGLLTPFGEHICASCAAKLQYAGEPYCRKCGKKLADETKEYCFDCMHRNHHYDMGRALYEYPCIHTSIYRFKYRGRREYAVFYAEETVRILGRHIQEWKADALIPVPLHPSRQRKRGYNQAEVLAEQIGKRMHIPVRTDIVKRVRRTTPQKELDNTERQNNLKKAFKICRNDVKLEVAVIIDDIYTTGSTIDEIAAELKRAGVRQVFFITLAIGRGL